MRQFVRRSTATLAAVTLIGALGACSDDEPSTNGDTTPSSTPSETSPSPSTTPTGPVEPEVPDAMGVESKRGAKAFVKYYWAVVDYAQATGDIETLQSLHAPDCPGCSSGPNWIRRIYKNHGKINGGEHQVLRQSVREIESSTGQRIYQSTVSLKNTKQSVLDDEGSVQDRFPAATSGYTFVVAILADGWQVTSIGVAA